MKVLAELAVMYLLTTLAMTVVILIFLFVEIGFKPELVAQSLVMSAGCSLLMVIGIWVRDHAYPFLVDLKNKLLYKQ